MSTLKQEIQGSVLVLTLNRPDKYNSFNREMALALIDALGKADADPAIRCVLLTGEGKAFCAGQDLGEAMDPSGPGIERIVAEHYNPIISLLRNLKKPVIALVNGVAAGAGANIAFACDIVLASRQASFIQAFSKIGLVPDSGGTYTLPRLLGPQLASALMITGDKLGAEDAKSFGLVYKVLEEQTARDEALSFALQVASMPTLAIARTKELLNASFRNDLAEQLEMEKRLQVACAGTHDYQEGVNAFLEKRKPLFRGT